MALFDALTGNAGHAAASNQRDVYGAIIPNLVTTSQTAYNNAGDLLRTGYGNARTDLGTGYGASTGAINAGAGGALDFLRGGTIRALGQLGSARDVLTANGGAYVPLSDLAASYRPATSTYMDSLGLNGPEGNARASAAFTPSLSYNFNLNQGLDAINRSQNARGMLNSGNTDRAAQTFGAGLASNEVNNWQNRLQGFVPLEQQAVTGAAAGNAGINNSVANTFGQGAGIVNQGGVNQAGVSTGQGGALSDLARSYYGALGAGDVAGGTALANNTTGGLNNYENLFLSSIPGYNDTFKQDANASNSASANALNLGMQLAKLGVSAFGGVPSGSFNFGGPGNGTNYAGLGSWA